MILLLRVEKYCLFLWVEEILGEIVRGCGTREEIEDEEEWMAVGAWVQVVLWVSPIFDISKLDIQFSVLTETNQFLCIS